jgi:hypothetical protein
VDAHPGRSTNPIPPRQVPVALPSDFEVMITQKT